MKLWEDVVIIINDCISQFSNGKTGEDFCVEFAEHLMYLIQLEKKKTQINE